MTESSSRKLIIAIDGPAGAGKSTIASRLARKLDYTSLESGAMYRALALKAILAHVSFEDEAELLKLARNSRIELEPAANGNRVLLDGQEVTERVRERDVSEAASRVSVHPEVREWMIRRQQEMGAGGGVVMEGRDIGTKVFPNADVKIFLDADPVERERRRLRQQEMGAGGGVVMEGRDIGTKVFPNADVKIFLDADPVERERRRLRQQDVTGTAAELAVQELRLRDQRDRNRAASPLVAAPDALVLDSTNMSEDEVLRRVEQAVREKLD